MISEISKVSLAAASGKTISSAQIVSEAKDVHGVLLIFTDGTEMSIDFYSQNVSAEVRNYRWGENGEATTVEPA
jgi:hypothetical protein